MKKCSYCGREYPDYAIVCSIDQQPLKPVEADARKMTAEDILFTDKEVIAIAKRQKAILWLIVAELVTFWIPLWIPFLMPFISILAGIIGIIFIYRLGKAVHSSAVWVYVVLAFIPLVGLVVLFILNNKATRILRQHQIHVGVMGARNKDLNKLIQSAFA
ncbi:MAG: hypothetical protein ACREDS_12885 [Limisphaerales bacterium]